MPLFMGELRGQISRDQIFDQLRGDYARSEDQDVHRVVLHALVRGVDIVAESGAHSWQFIGRDGGSDAAAADQNSPIDLLRTHCLADGLSKIRVIDRRRAVRSY